MTFIVRPLRSGVVIPIPVSRPLGHIDLKSFHVIALRIPREGLPWATRIEGLTEGIPRPFSGDTWRFETRADQENAAAIWVAVPGTFFQQSDGESFLRAALEIVVDGPGNETRLLGRAELDFDGDVDPEIPWSATSRTPWTD